MYEAIVMAGAHEAEPALTGVETAVPGTHVAYGVTIGTPVLPPADIRGGVTHIGVLIGSRSGGGGSCGGKSGG